MLDISKASDSDLNQLINNRWKSSDSLWEVVRRVYKQNTALYDMEYYDKDRMPEYLTRVAIKQFRVRSNRIFTDTEAVINALIANPPVPNLLPNRDTPEAKALAQKQEKFFMRRYEDLNVKETMRKGYRNLYFGRLFVVKVFWNFKTNDFDVKALDPRQVRVSSKATKEIESEFAIEEVPETLEGLIARFPLKKEEILKKFGYKDEKQVSINNPDLVYREAWIYDHVIFQYDQSLILGKMRNPYWDWDGLMMTPEEMEQLENLQDNPEARRMFLNGIKISQDERKEQAGDNPKAAYYYNYFDVPRKPYIFGTVLNNEQTPIGRTDFINEAAPLQEAVDRRKRQFDENAELMNGIIKVDAGVMSKEDAQKLRYETSGIIYGKGVATGVSRETGQPLPQFMYQDMQDSRMEIDNIMAASSAFRGERQGEETKAGRLALIDQSFLRLNELVQLGDFISREMFAWFYQLAKLRYTTMHYAKTLGKADAMEIIGLQQDDFENGVDIRVIPGKSLPEDKQFQFQLAQQDVQKGILSPIDYFKKAGYESPLETARNAVEYQLNPARAVGLTDDQIAGMVPQNPGTPPPPPPTIGGGNPSEVPIPESSPLSGTFE